MKLGIDHLKGEPTYGHAVHGVATKETPRITRIDSYIEALLHFNPAKAGGNLSWALAQMP